MVRPERFERPTLRFVVLWRRLPWVSGSYPRLSTAHVFKPVFFSCSCLAFLRLAAKVIVR